MYIKKKPGLLVEWQDAYVDWHLRPNSGSMKLMWVAAVFSNERRVETRNSVLKPYKTLKSKSNHWTKKMHKH